MGDYGQRAEDHNVIVGLYDDISYATSQTPKGDAMGRFLDEGNIRIMPENGSIELSSTVKPTTEQLSTIRRFLGEHVHARIEFSKEGKGVDSKVYENGVNADQVINDIKRFYDEGKIGGSDLNNFRFSKELKSKTNSPHDLRGSAGKTEKKYGVRQEAKEAYQNADEALIGVDGAKSSYIKPQDVSDEYKQTFIEFTESTDEELKQGILNQRNGKAAGFKKKELGSVKKEEVERIKELLGRDVSEYKRSIESDRLLHIDERHGIKGKENHTMTNANDIARAQYVMDNYDSIEIPLDTSGKPKKSKQYTDAGANGERRGQSPIIEYRKRVNGDYVVVEAVPDSTAKELRVETVYFDTGKTRMPKNKIDDSQKSNAISPPTDARNEAGLTSNDNILKKKQDVKSEAETPAETPKAESKGSERYVKVAKASEKLKKMTDTAEDYGIDTTARVDEFNELGKKIHGEEIHLSNVKKTQKYATDRVDVSDFAAHDFEVVDKLANAKAKKIGDFTKGRVDKTLPFLNSPTVKISDLLEVVKEKYPDTLSEDVLRRFGTSKKEVGEQTRDSLTNCFMRKCKCVIL